MIFRKKKEIVEHTPIPQTKMDVLREIPRDILKAFPLEERVKYRVPFWKIDFLYPEDLAKWQMVNPRKRIKPRWCLVWTFNLLVIFYLLHKYLQILGLMP